jgi:tRNA threonylcarbamoyladenosine biosynthesis protein TsaE
VNSSSPDPIRTVRIESHAEGETEALAEWLARELEPPCTVALVGPLGAGKTCFVRGLARGLGCDEAEVCSPSFVYLVDYPGAHTTLVHADLYRLGGLEPDDAARAFEGIGLRAAIGADAVTVVEWWDHYVGAVPARLILVEIAIRTVEDRTITLSFFGHDLEACAASITRFAAHHHDE